MLQSLKTANVHAVLFDLDGTLVDSAPDLAAALNHLLQQHGLATLPYAAIRPFVSNGANALITLGFGSGLSEAQFKLIKDEFIEHYQQNIANESALFEHLDATLLALDKNDVPWGIVTNKPAYLTVDLVDKLALTSRAKCVVCGDQVANSKPHPESIYLACQKLGVLPSTALYIGDAERDIRAGRLAGTQTIACAYGYIPADQDISDWQADYIVNETAELLTLAQSLTSPVKQGRSQWSIASWDIQLYGW